ncbi:MAG: DUF11 domain-containing protein [Candidatus Obscuribacterales bacterium]|nr:DUF11 domain-containing protein [Steroidobacteraceae bacterium]
MTMTTHLGLGLGAWVRFGITAALLMTTSHAFAQDKACVSLKTDAQIEQDYVDAQGKQAKRLTPPGKVVPGNEIIWTITATNTCTKPAEKVAVENAVPEHMVYVANSAMGPGTEITYSLNGRDYVKASELTVREADGTTRPARADEIKKIRWVFASAFAPNATGFARYRAKVK